MIKRLDKGQSLYLKMHYLKNNVISLYLLQKTSGTRVLQHSTLKIREENQIYAGYRMKT